MKNIPACGKNDEQQAQHPITQIRVDVVEIRQISQRMGTQEIKVTQILISRIVQHLRPKKKKKNYNYRFSLEILQYSTTFW